MAWQKSKKAYLLCVLVISVLAVGGLVAFAKAGKYSPDSLASVIVRKGNHKKVKVKSSNNKKIKTLASKTLDALTRDSYVKGESFLSTKSKKKGAKKPKKKERSNNYHGFSHFKGKPLKPTSYSSNLSVKPSKRDTKGTIDLSGSSIVIQHSPDGDYNQDGHFNPNEMITITITLKNSGTADARDLILKSYIDRDILGYVHNVEGYGADSSHSSYLSWDSIYLATTQQIVYKYEVQIKGLKQSKTVEDQVSIKDGKGKSVLKLKSQPITISP